MSADFWAGYFSGAIGIVIGNPLDILKVQLQADQRRGSLRPDTRSSGSLSFLRGILNSRDQRSRTQPDAMQGLQRQY